MSSQFGKQRIDHELLNKKNSENNDEDDTEDSETATTLDGDLIQSRQIDCDTSIENLIDYEKRNFHLSDVCDFIKRGMQAIVDDEVTIRFDTEGKLFTIFTVIHNLFATELPSWNLLTRTNKKYTHLSIRLTILWGIGCAIRYLILFPTRIIVTIIGVSLLIICTGIIGCLPDNQFKRTIYWHACLVCFRVMTRAFSGIITFHDRHNMAKPGGICVANHTSPIVSAKF